MKIARIFIIACLAVTCLGFMADRSWALATEGVKVSVQASNAFKARKNIKAKAKEAAVVQYARRVSPGLRGTCVSKLRANYARFAKTLTQAAFKFDRKAGANTGTAFAAYRVNIDDSGINRFLEEIGCGVQAGRKGDVLFFIMEERPDMATIELILNEDDSAGVRKLRGLGPFVTFYTSFQRRIRDAITRKAGQEGLSLRWLEKEPRMKKFKESDDDPLMGVYYDLDLEDFAINDDLMADVKKRYAADNAIIFYYRIDSLYFDQVKRILKAVISISLMDLKSGSVKSVGAQEYAVRIANDQPAVAIRDGLADVASNAAGLLMNDAKKIARSMASGARHRAIAERGKPVMVTVMLKSKRAMHKLKNALGKKNIRRAEVQGGSLIIEVRPGIKPDDFVFGDLYDAFDKVGVDVPEDNVKIEGRKVFVEE